MASSLYKAQYALNVCEKHNKKENHAYCKTCREKICSSCIKESHYSHDWDIITDILKEKRHSLPEECRKIRASQLPCLRNELDRFEEKIQEQDARFEQNKSALNGSRKSYIDEINNLFDGKIDECRNNTEIAKQIYIGEREGLKRKVGYLDMITKSLDKDINTLPDHDILDMEMEMRENLEKALSYSADKCTCSTVFVPGQINLEMLMDMIGDVYCMSVIEKNEIDKFSVSIQTIESLSDKNAWIMTENDEIAQLIDGNGEQLGSMRTECSDLVVSDGGNIVLVSFDQSSISVLTQNEEKITEFDTNPLYPFWITKTMKDEIIVTLIDNGDHYNLLPSSRRVVHLMDLTGDMLHSYEFKEDGKTRLFTLPMKTAENKNTDICVINWFSESSGELVVLHRNGRVNFTHGVDAQKVEFFLPTDVECDSKSSILFSEFHSRAIHVLNAKGLYLYKLCQYDQCIVPYAVSVNGDNLWCGMNWGTLKLYKYRN